MDLSIGVAGGSGDGPENQNSHRGRKSYHVLTTYQRSQLEAFFKQCPHPDENQGNQIATELGLEPKQVKFWFQNKRTKIKNQSERAYNTAIRVENERIHCENILIRETLKSVFCPSCGGPPSVEEEHELNIQKLLHENAQLKREHERVSNLLARYMEREMLQPEPQFPILGSSNDPSRENPLKQVVETYGRLDEDFVPDPTSEGADTETAMMIEAAAAAMEELVALISINEPLWVRSFTDGKLVLHRESYESLYPKANHFKNSYFRVESSKYSGIVNMSGIQLVDMFLDADKWVSLFPTIVTKAQTIEVVKGGFLGNRSGALQLMYGGLHVLSPLVPFREFFFLRYCLEVQVGVWMIVDASFDNSKDENTIPLSRCWRRPSGCMIQQLPNGNSMVTWVEHVEVDARIQTHRLYRDLVCSNIAYGAERWILTLQRMCARFASFSLETIPIHDAGGVITSPEGRRSVMKLSHRMFKIFSGILDMSGKLDFSRFNEVNNSGVRISVRKNTDPGQPNGLIVSAATSLWLPLHPQRVFQFFMDENRRVQWDVLTYGNAVHEIARVSNGIHPGNRISIIRPFDPSENSVFVLQETCIDPLASYIVYAPLDFPAMNMALSGGVDPSFIPILPSGFIISGDCRSPVHGAIGSGGVVARPAGGSLLTVAFQILACTEATIGQLNMESVASVNTLISSAVQNIKDALRSSGLN